MKRDGTSPLMNMIATKSQKPSLQKCIQRSLLGLRFAHVLPKIIEGEELISYSAVHHQGKCFGFILGELSCHPSLHNVRV